jgi:hypothetical protein
MIPESTNINTIKSVKHSGYDNRNLETIFQYAHVALLVMNVTHIRMIYVHRLFVSLFHR